MSAVTPQEIVEALRRGIPANAFHKFDWIESNKALANRIEAEGIAPSDGYLLVHKDIMTLTVECRCGVQQAKPVHHYLKQADEETHRRVDDAVRAGRIFDKRFRGGFVSVPAEPTQEMIDAGIMFGTSPTKVSIIWSNMLAAAPEVKP